MTASRYPRKPRPVCNCGGGIRLTCTRCEWSQACKDCDKVGTYVVHARGCPMADYMTN
ncbi:hypothetical protein [Streptomyces sp. SID3343]|uniref:hypothetical protein n=1 Tax=Streptomyces sp. SID3343 TaxID=2690260 RepID=UPI00137193AA|nr:hypothetical protein [Streptomyces sp. SID3343]MYW04505.1 hypothetical protein [Streptomyces sp. SID3343]